MPKLTRMQKEVIELKFYDIKVAVNMNFKINQDSIINQLFPTYIRFCRQDPNIILNVLETYEVQNGSLYQKTFLIKKSSIGYPFEKFDNMINNFLDNIDKCGQNFIEELVFAKSINFTEIRKGFSEWKRDHITPKIKILKDI